MNMNYEELNDEELVSKLEDSALMDRFENSEDWKIIREACRRAGERAKEALVKADPDKKTLILELQKIAQIYGNFLPSLVNSFKQDGALAFEEAKGRGLLRKFRTTFS